MKLALLALLVPAVALASLDKDLIRGRIRAHAAELRACYDAALVKEPALEGRVRVSFLVGTDGKVREVKAEGMPAVHACVERVIGRIEFPKSARGPVSITYPLVFRRDTRR